MRMQHFQLDIYSRLLRITTYLVTYASHFVAITGWRPTWCQPRQWLSTWGMAWRRSWQNEQSTLLLFCLSNMSHLQKRPLSTQFWVESVSNRLTYFLASIVLDYSKCRWFSLNCRLQTDTFITLRLNAPFNNAQGASLFYYIYYPWSIFRLT